jgi:hypothetical protein
MRVVFIYVRMTKGGVYETPDVGNRIHSRFTRGDLGDPVGKRNRRVQGTFDLGGSESREDRVAGRGHDA